MMYKSTVSNGVSFDTKEELFAYKQGKEDVIDEIYNKLDEGVCVICEYAQEDCFKYCGKNGYEVETFKKWLEQLKEYKSE